MSLLTTWHPGLEFSDSVFDNLLPNLQRNFERHSELGTYVPAANLTETETDYFLDLAIPGLNKEDFHISVHEHVLRIAVSSAAETDHETALYTRQEFSFHDFQRSFHLPKNADEAQLEVHYINGILKITMPKNDPIQHADRQIPVH